MALIATLIASSGLAHAQRVMIATPGALAKYTYFGGDGGGGDTGPREEKLQSCLYTAASPDVTVRADPAAFYSLKEVRGYFRAFGGDGGSGVNGGGGGSSAILVNGAVIGVAPGGNGAVVAAPETKGEFVLKPNDTVRLISGGGGGAGAVGWAGGAGGAGWRGGGAGSASAPGMGGTTTGGAGGGGSIPGTAGNVHNGGVSTYPDGNSIPVGNSLSDTFRFTYHAKYEWDDSDTDRILQDDYRIPATPTRSGSYARPVPLNQMPFCKVTYSGGFGGAWGIGGSPVPENQWSCVYANPSNTVAATNNMLYTSMCGGLNCNVKQNTYTMSLTSKYSESTDFLSNTRIANGRSQINGYENTDKGSLPGQIVLMYHSIDCTLLK